MTSDYDKAELLLTVAKHYIRDDELRTAYLDAVGIVQSQAVSHGIDGTFGQLGKPTEVHHFR